MRAVLTHQYYFFSDQRQDARGSLHSTDMADSSAAYMSRRAVQFIGSWEQNRPELDLPHLRAELQLLVRV